MWFYLRRDKVKERLAALCDESDRAEREADELEAELDVAAQKLASIGAKWDAAREIHERLARLDSLRRAYWAPGASTRRSRGPRRASNGGCSTPTGAPPVASPSRSCCRGSSRLWATRWT
jgi:hypothetical protein